MTRREHNPPTPYRYHEGELLLTLHVQPGASRTAWAGVYGAAALRLKLAAPAVDGKANRACVRFLAQEAGVSASAVEIVRGERSRDKAVRIRAVAPERMQTLLERWAMLEQQAAVEQSKVEQGKT